MLPALLVGAALIVAGVGMMLAHRRTWKRQAADPATESAERHHLHARFRRRMQTSGLIALIGVLIPLGDWLPVLRNDAFWFTLYWIGVLVLVAWVALLGLGDLFATHTHSQAAFSRLREQQRELQDEVERLRKKRANGHVGEE